MVLWHPDILRGQQDGRYTSGPADNERSIRIQPWFLWLLLCSGSPSGSKDEYYTQQHQAIQTFCYEMVSLRQCFGFFIHMEAKTNSSVKSPNGNTYLDISLGNKITLWLLWGLIVIDGPTPRSARHWSDLASAPSLLPATISLEQWFKDHTWVYAHPNMLRIREGSLGKRTVSWMKLQPQVSSAQT